MTYQHACATENNHGSKIVKVLSPTNFELDIKSVNSGQSCYLKSIMAKAFRRRHQTPIFEKISKYLVVCQLW